MAIAGLLACVSSESLASDELLLVIVSHPVLLVWLARTCLREMLF